MINLHMHQAQARRMHQAQARRMHQAEARHMLRPGTTCHAPCSQAATRQAATRQAARLPGCQEDDSAALDEETAADAANALATLVSASAVGDHFEDKYYAALRDAAGRKA